MPFSTAGKNLMLNALKGTNPTTPLTHASLHTASPGDSGTNEVTGGTPAYARKAIAYNTASGGTMDDSTNGITFDVPAGTTVTHVGYWSAVTAGTFLGYSTQTSETFGAQGTYTVTDSDLSISDS
jgi:hypothetical protein